MNEASPAKKREWLERVTHDLPTDRVRKKQKRNVLSTQAPAASEVAQQTPGIANYLTIKGQLHERVLDELSEEELADQSEQRLTERVDGFVQRVLSTEELPLNQVEQTQLADDLREEILGVGPLAPYMADPAVTDILVIGPDKVYVERFGQLEKTSTRFRNDDHLVRIIQRIASRMGRRIDESVPMVDARLADGSRVNATLPPVTIDGPTLSIRRFGHKRLRMQELESRRMFSAAMKDFLHLIVRNRVNVVVAGGTGAGKSTLLGAICEAIPRSERIITIEDAAELILDQEHLVRKETRPANLEGEGRITARDLVINSLRMRPDRIIVGEVRGPEALDMLQAMNTGHDGSLTTIHCNSPRDALSRLETMVLMAEMDLPSRAIREQIASAIDIIVFVRRFDDGTRRVERISELTGLEDLTPQLQDIFIFRQTGRDGKSIQGQFEATGIIPRCVERLREWDESITVDQFRKPADRPATGV